MLPYKQDYSNDDIVKNAIWFSNISIDSDIEISMRKKFLEQLIRDKTFKYHNQHEVVAVYFSGPSDDSSLMVLGFYPNGEFGRYFYGNIDVINRLDENRYVINNTDQNYSVFRVDYHDEYVFDASRITLEPLSSNKCRKCRIDFTKLEADLPLYSTKEEAAIMTGKSSLIVHHEREQMDNWAEECFVDNIWVFLLHTTKMNKAGWVREDVIEQSFSFSNAG